MVRWRTHPPEPAHPGFPRLRSLLTTSLLTLASIGAGSSAASGETADPPPMGRPPEMDRIAFLQGEWDEHMEMRTAPDEPFTAVEATATVSTILEGCVQVLDFRAELMGMPFHGIDHTVFDRNTGAFQSVWVDNMSANFSIMSGNFVDGVLVQTGTNHYAGREVAVRTAASQQGENEVLWIMEESDDGGATWTTSMKMTYRRK